MESKMVVEGFPRDQDRPEIMELREVAAKLAVMLDVAGISEDDMAADFKAQRAAGRDE